MKLHTIISAGFGFLTPLVLVVLIGGALGLIGYWFEFGNQTLFINNEQAWGGAFLFAAICVIIVGTCMVFF